MTKRMLIDALHPEETRVVIADENQVYDFDFVTIAKKQLKGNIYLAKITRVEPSLQAAFVEYGCGKQGFLPFSEIHADYYQIPVSDRKRLMEEAQAEEENEEAHDHSHDNAEDAPQSPEQAANEAEQANATEVADISMATLSEAERPAYLSQTAIDVSTSEEPLDHFEGDDTPISAALSEGEDVTSDSAESEAPRAEEGASGEAPAGEGVETLANEEEEYQSRPKKNVFMKRYKIQEVIRRGQIVLVQVIKEERGNKGASLTTYLSLAGRYCVLMPNSPKDGGISRKIASGEDRKRLKAISTELRLAQGMSVIIRTAGMERTRAEIKRDFDYLVKLWNQIREDTLVSNAPALIYEESDIIKRAIRDQYTGDIDELIIEGDEGHKTAKDFMKMLLPSHTLKIKHYKEATPLFYAYNIEEQLLSMHDPVVKLRSGGYLVINPTEALISVDVNSGRATGERNIEETAVRTNLEAAAEVARQLRLRDLAGLVVIDFIDMMESRNRRAVEKLLKDSLKADRAKIQLGRISPFGLLEMSRQRIRPSVSESNMVQCEHCVGRGYIRSHESMSIQMIRSIEKEASAGVWSSLRLIAPQAVALHLLNTKRDILRGIEQRYNLTVQVLIDTDLASSEFNLEKMRRSQNDRSEGGEQRRDRGERGEGRGERGGEGRGGEGRGERGGEGRGERGGRDRGERGGRDRGERGGRDRNRDRERPVAAEAVVEDINDTVDAVLESDGEGRIDRGGELNSDGTRKRSRRRRGGRNRGDRDRSREDRPASNNQEGASEGDITEVQDADGMEAANNNEPGEGQNLDSNGRPPRTRGGRGRRRWRDRDERGGENRPAEGTQGGDEAPQPERQQERYVEPVAARHTDGNTLPAFATEDRPLIELASNRPAPTPVVASPMVESAQRDASAPAKKGWWQKMIELDD